MFVGRQILVFLLYFGAGFLCESPAIISTVLGNDGCVQFDAPASVVACDVTPPEMLVDNSEFRLVQLLIPVSTRVTCGDNQSVLQLQLEIRTAGPGIQVVDYAPRTTMYSEFDGPIAVESHEESNASLGLDAGGTIAESLKLSAQAGIGKTRGYRENYQRIPQQKLLLASGTLHRGSAVYFKFRHSPQTTLEGGQELSITLRVPLTWRGGIVRVDCQASGAEPGMLGRTDSFVAGSESFLVATWLKGDGEARSIVTNYCDSETTLRQLAKSFGGNRNNRTARDPISQLGQLLGGSEPTLPDDWTEKLALYDSRSIQSRIRPHLSDELQQVTDAFLVSRAQVLQLAR